jgi:hypothetical protein
VHINGAIFFSSGIRFVYSIDPLNVSNIQITHRVEYGSFSWLATDGSECAWNANTWMYQLTFVGALVAASVITETLIAFLISFTWNVSLPISSISAFTLVTLVTLVIVSVSVAGHFD